MIERPVRLPATLDPLRVPELVEGACDALGLVVSLRGTLRQYAGCLHWHCKRGKSPGTLEVTWWPRERRLWLSVQAGRQAEWTNGALGQLAAALAARLSEHACNPAAAPESKQPSD